MIARAEEELGPIRERRAALAARPDDVRDVIAQGTRRARTVAEDTMATVRKLVGLGGMP
jgi:tryptophanyl-tRNA synthetase